MDIVHAIEDVAKGSGDKPKDDVIIFKSGEVSLVLAKCNGCAFINPTLVQLAVEETDAEGNQVPLHAEL